MSKEVVISEKGQVTIPKALRDRLGLSPGTVIVFKVDGSRLIGEKDPSSLPVGKWRGKGRLPRGMTIDSYLKLARDGNRR